MKRVATVIALALVVPGIAHAGQGIGLAETACLSQAVPGEESDTATARCRRGAALLGATAVVVTPDGRNLYVAASGASAVAAFSRAASGAVSAIGCASNNGTNGVDGTKRACADGDALSGAAALAVSADGKNVYAAAYASSGVAVFSRDLLTGKLTQTGCVRAVSTCVGARGLSGASAIVVSPDGRNVYVASYDADAVVSFARDPSTGALKGLGCVSDDGSDRQCASGNALRGAEALAISSDGHWLYVAAADSNAVLTFERDPATGILTQRGCVLDHAPRKGSCVSGNAIVTPDALTLAPDGRTLFVASYDSNSIAVFARDPATGKITQRGCLSDVTYSEENDRCAHAAPLESPAGLAVSPDGRRLFVTVDSGLAALERDPVTGGLHYAGCVTYPEYDEDVTKDCIVGGGLVGTAGVALSPNGSNVYIAASASNALATFVPAAALSVARTLSRRGSLAVRVSCPEMIATTCAGMLTLRRSSDLGYVTAPRRFAVAPGRSRVVVLRLRLAHRRPERLIVAAWDRRHSPRAARLRLVLRR
jgi:DNA-binding beta-propeller fold protein YncE